MTKSIMDWDVVENGNFGSDCLLGFFRNNFSEIGEKFGCLTGVRSVTICPDARYEENYNRRWKHFRLATREEIQARTIIVL